MSSPSKTDESTLRDVINEVTKEKLTWLERQRESLQSHFTPILEKYEKPENKANLAFLKEIHDTLVAARDDNPDPTKTRELSVFLNWINADDKKASVYFGSNRLVENWINVLIKTIKYRIEKCEYSCLYANVMSQYMENNASESKEEDEDGGNVNQKESLLFTTKEESMQEFSQLVFSDEENFNKKSLEDFLNTELFDLEDKRQKKILKGCRESVLAFCNSFDTSYPRTIGVTNIRLCIDGLLKDNFLGEAKIQTLNELKGNKEALEEVCTLIEKRIRDYAEWSWPEPVLVDFRRNIAGQYHAYLDEDIITAIMLYYLGAKWSIQMKTVFKSIYDSTMWKCWSDPVRDLYRTSHSIDGYRRELHRSTFLSGLPNKLEDLTGTKANNDDQYYRSFRRINDYPTEISPEEVKKKLLYVIVNDIHLNYVLRPTSPITIVQTDVESFSHSIVHDVILSIMKFFGVTPNWLNFFKKFLETPMRVGSRKAPVQIRKRGAPISHTFTSLFEETVLFIIHLYVNQVSGINTFSIQDDFWFWSCNKDSVIKAWAAMQTFAKLADLKLKEEKSASVVCSSLDKPGTINPGPKPLPQRQVRWGFVVLHSDGVFRISRVSIEPHIKEMRDCLLTSETVINWINCHNKYIRFFIQNFIEPAKTLQRQHVQQILETLQFILGKVHRETGGDVVAALKLKFSDILGDKDIIDAWVHWPARDGGLNLYNPFLDFIPLHEAYSQLEEREEDDEYYGTEIKRFDDCVSSDLDEWQELLEKSMRRRQMRKNSSVRENVETVTDFEIFGKNDPHDDDDDDDDDPGNRFQRVKRRKKRINYATWCQRTREYRSSRWRSHYEDLLTKLTGCACDTGNWREWLYDGQLHSKLGPKEDEFVDTKMVPLSLISSMQGDRVHSRN